MNLEKLVNIFNALNQITISGYQNITTMNYCMQNSKQFIEEVQKEQAQSTPDILQD